MAHKTCRYKGKHKNPLVGFRFGGEAFQTTVAAAGDTEGEEEDEGGSGSEEGPPFSRTD